MDTIFGLTLSMNPSISNCALKMKRHVARPICGKVVYQDADICLTSTLLTMCIDSYSNYHIKLQEER